MKNMPVRFPNRKEIAENVDKNLYLPAQSGKIRMENGVYCGLKGVKSMIEVIYKEETDTTKETAEYVKLPNNVRQIGEIKGRKNIYGRLCLHL